MPRGEGTKEDGVLENRVPVADLIRLANRRLLASSRAEDEARLQGHLQSGRRPHGDPIAANLELPTGIGGPEGAQ